VGSTSDDEIRPGERGGFYQRCRRKANQSKALKGDLVIMCIMNRLVNDSDQSVRWLPLDSTPEPVTSAKSLSVRTSKIAMVQSHVCDARLNVR
jgi:hypothetical protein